MKKDKIIGCPHCSNKRLFDLAKEGTGSISIKCPLCKKIAVIHLRTENVTRKIMY